MPDQVQPATLFVSEDAGQVSVAAGEEISFHISASGDAFDMRIERVGAERTEVLEKSQIACATIAAMLNS